MLIYIRTKTGEVLASPTQRKSHGEYGETIYQTEDGREFNEFDVEKSCGSLHPILDGYWIEFHKEPIFMCVPAPLL